MLRRKTDGPELRYQVSAPYEIDEYPIEENESKNYFERQLSTRYGGLVCLYVCIYN
jgi:hypothetical protein